MTDKGYKLVSAAATSCSAQLESTTVAYHHVLFVLYMHKQRQDVPSLVAINLPRDIDTRHIIPTFVKDKGHRRRPSQLQLGLTGVEDSPRYS